MATTSAIGVSPTLDSHHQPEGPDDEPDHDH